MSTKKMIVIAAIAVGGYLLYTRVTAKPAAVKTSA